MRKILEKIINTSVQAPSGNNSQPWKFVVYGKMFQLWNLPEKDEILFNYKERGSLISHGGIIENIHITAAEFGYNIQTILFPNKEEPNLVAEMTISKGGDDYKYKSLFSEILERKTNRRKYDNKKLSQRDTEFLQNFSKSENKNGFEVFLSDNINDIKLAAEYFSAGDKLIFENKKVHHSLFSTVNWTKEEENKNREGLFVKTKELSVVTEFIFKNFLSKWSFVSSLQRLNISEKARQKRQKLYERTAMIGMIVSPDFSPNSIVNAGRIMQRFWLTTTSIKISFQPLTVGLLYLGQRTYDDVEMTEFTKDQSGNIKTAYSNIINKILKKDVIPVFSFRLGYSKPPTAHSLKKKPFIIYKK